MVTYLRRLGVAVYTETTGTMPSRYIRVERVGGSAEWISRDIDIEIRVVAETRSALWDLVADIETAMYDLSGQEATPGIYIDDVTVAFGFAWDPPANQNICAAIGTFTLTVRPTA
jgi:hypothetical protein